MPLADKYRVNDASLTCLFKKHAKPEGPIPGAKAAKGPKGKFFNHAFMFHSVAYN